MLFHHFAAQFFAGLHCECIQELAEAAMLPTSREAFMQRVHDPVKGLQPEVHADLSLVGLEGSRCGPSLETINKAATKVFDSTMASIALMEDNKANALKKKLESEKENAKQLEKEIPKRASEYIKDLVREEISTMVPNATTSTDVNSPSDVHISSPEDAVEVCDELDKMIAAPSPSAPSAKAKAKSKATPEKKKKKPKKKKLSPSQLAIAAPVATAGASVGTAGLAGATKKPRPKKKRVPKPGNGASPVGGPGPNAPPAPPAPWHHRRNAQFDPRFLKDVKPATARTDRWTRWEENVRADQGARDVFLSRRNAKGGSPRSFPRFAAGYWKGHQGPTLTQRGDVYAGPGHGGKPSGSRGGTRR